ncbi:hypothetical protein MTO96_032371 [Rhipicephalus appendiculatus]
MDGKFEAAVFEDPDEPRIGASLGETSSFAPRIPAHARKRRAAYKECARHEGLLLCRRRCTSLRGSKHYGETREARKRCESS